MTRERRPAVRGRAARGLEPVDELPTEKAFVLQLTRASGPRLATFAGRVEHLLTGRRARFATLEEFVAALGRFLSPRRQR